MYEKVFNSRFLSFYAYAQNTVYVTANYEILSISGGAEIIGSESYETKWTRPSCWPVGDNYTVETWTQFEEDKIKLVMEVPPDGTPVALWLNISESASVTNKWFVDWYADGANISNYADSALATFTYPSSYWGKYVPVKVYGDNQTRDYDLHLDNSHVFNRTNNYSVVECINPGTNALGGQYLANFVRVYTLRSVHTRNADMNAKSGAGAGLYGGNSYNQCRNLAHVLASNCTLQKSTFYECNGLRYLELYDIQGNSLPDQVFQQSGYDMVKDYTFVNYNYTNNVSQYSFYDTGFRRVIIPNLQNLANNSFNGSYRLEYIAPMPNLKVVGTFAFYGCNLPFSVITNFVLNLTNTVSSQTINFQLNPGSTEFGVWYTNGAPSSASNNLASKGWYIQW